MSGVGARDRARPERVLLLGARGMLGRAWLGLLRSHAIEADSLDRSGLDLERIGDVRAIPLDTYSHVINCAAWTDVDGAEDQEERATAVNGVAVGELARRCALEGRRLLTYSTDYVFAGEAHTPYRTDAPRAPVNAYGRSKAAGEEMLLEAGGPWLCVRTSWVYAPWGRNFVRTIARLASERDELSVVSDQRGRPTSAEGLARASLALLMSGAEGFVHATDGGECTWFDLAAEVVRLVGAPCAVSACASDAYPRPAPRPSYSVLDLSETESRIGPMIDWRIAVGDVVRRMDPPGENP